MDRLPRRLIIGVGILVIVALSIWLFKGRATTSIDSYAQCAQQGYPIRESNPPTCSDGRHTFLGPLLTPTPSPEPVVSQEFSLLVDGDSGGTYPERSQVFTNQSDWRRYWSEVHAALPAIPPILPVDFTVNDVVALNMGRQMTGGYNFKVTGITTNSTGTSINVTKSTPTISCTVTQAITNHYLIVRTAKLTEPVSFRMATEPRRCDK